MCCYSQRKVKNSESKSQRKLIVSVPPQSCYSQRKVKNSESKSQHKHIEKHLFICCYSQRKVKNSESKSQLFVIIAVQYLVVIHSVKLKILKANHNSFHSMLIVE